MGSHPPCEHEPGAWGNLGMGDVGSFTLAIDTQQVWQRCWFPGSTAELRTALTPHAEGNGRSYEQDKHRKNITKPPLEIHNDRGVEQCQAQLGLLKSISAEAEVLRAHTFKTIQLCLEVSLLRVPCMHPVCCVGGYLNSWIMCMLKCLEDFSPWSGPKAQVSVVK